MELRERRWRCGWSWARRSGGTGFDSLHHSSKKDPSLIMCAISEQKCAPGYALTVAHKRKMREVEEDCRRQGIAFLPMAAESFGGWHPVAEREVRKLAAALSRHSGQEEEEALCHLWGRLGILLQRGNAAILGNRVPTHPVADVNGEQ